MQTGAVVQHQGPEDYPFGFTDRFGVDLSDLFGLQKVREPLQSSGLTRS